MKKLSKLELLDAKVLNESEMKNITGGYSGYGGYGGIICYRENDQGGTEPYSPGSVKAAGAWLAVWDAAGKNARCFG